MMKPEPRLRAFRWKRSDGSSGMKGKGACSRGDSCTRVALTFTTAGLTARASSTQAGAGTVGVVTATGRSVQSGVSVLPKPGETTPSAPRVKMMATRPAAGQAQRRRMVEKFMVPPIVGARIDALPDHSGGG